MCTAGKAITQFMNDEPVKVEVYEINQPDVLLWAMWCIQQYGKMVSFGRCYEKYGELYGKIISYIIDGKHENLFLHDNGLLYSQGRDKASVGSARSKESAKKE